MATYYTAPAHERLNIFFGEFFRQMRKAPPESYGSFLARAEQEFQRLGYRERMGGRGKYFNRAHGCNRRHGFNFGLYS